MIFSIRIDERIAHDIENQAKKERRSRNSMIEIMLLEYLEQHGIKTEPKSSDSSD